MKKPIAVVQGSLNCDITAAGDILPKLGETVIGNQYALSPGGKGANQAVQLARLGAETYLIGRVGSDSYGDLLIESLREAGVRTDFVKRDPAPTGIGLVQCGANGQYYAMVVPGANGACSARDVSDAQDVIAVADVMLCQLETTEEALFAAADLAQKHAVSLIINPAPAKKMDPRLFEAAHTITPNETEAAFYADLEPSALDNSSGLRLAAERLLRLGARRVLMTLGARGCCYADAQRQFIAPPFPVKAVDTTAAGDAFNGAYAYAVAVGTSLEEALCFANAAGAAAASKSGAQPSICRLEVLNQLIKDRK